MALSFATLTACSAVTPPDSAAEATRSSRQKAPDFAAKVAGLEHRTGLFDLYVDRVAGKLWAVLPAPAGSDGVIGDYLYVEGIVTGLGSNPVGLDRSQLGGSRVVRLRRVGSRILLEEPNLGFRAISEDPEEVAAVRESFATSVLWATAIAGEDSAGRLLIDLTGFVMRDAHAVVARLANSGQGSFSLDRERSAIDFAACLAFPKNLEFEALLTFAGSKPGAEVRSVAPHPNSISLVLHQSLLELPPDGYRPREQDPRMGSFAVEFADYAAPLDRPLMRRWIVRHRLEKTDPTAASSPVREPIVYYVDRGAPEPVRSALVEGASWWAHAFAAAGFEEAFRVEVLPPDAHPLDVRYNVIQWVHRSTRGWSYGGGVIDPRTGEMIKGHVNLGSLRVRQDRLLFEGLVGTDRTGSGGPDDPVQVALARIRQLSAHEVGHTLGLAHNFAASTFGRASVMDYPAPLVQIDGAGELDLSQAYAAGMGAWDLAAIRWAYADLRPGSDESAELDAIVRETLDRGLFFLTDRDARSPSSAHPAASLWDNGDDPIAALRQTIRVRAIGLERFGEANLRRGRPLAELEEVFVPLYLHHRFQVAAATKLVGGVDYRHALRGDGQPPPEPVAADRQRSAIATIAETLEPSFLDIPESALQLLVPRAPGLSGSRELFASRTRPVFDALGAASVAADLTLRGLLDPVRAARMVDLHRRTEASPDFSELLDDLIATTFAEQISPPARRREIVAAVQTVFVEHLEALSLDGDAAPSVRARADRALSDLLQRIDGLESVEPSMQAHYDALAVEIGRHLARPSPARQPSKSARPEPPGQPIGSASISPQTLGSCGWDDLR
jgi:hypothetical protein